MRNEATNWKMQKKNVSSVINIMFIAVLLCSNDNARTNEFP